MTKTDDSGEWATIPARGRRPRKRETIDLCSSDDNNNDDGGDAVIYSPPSAFHPFVLVLVGIPGSGKSSFASQLETSMPSKFVRINQDSLKTRKKCENLARRVLAEGKVAVIDRTNFNPEQRKTWIDIAEEKSVHCECIVFAYHASLCITRCQQRRGHETIHPSKAAGVVSLISKQFRIPVPRSKNGGQGGENFHRLETVSSFKMADNLAKSYLGQR